MRVGEWHRTRGHWSLYPRSLSLQRTGEGPEHKATVIAMMPKATKTCPTTSPHTHNSHSNALVHVTSGLVSVLPHDGGRQNKWELQEKQQ